MPDPLEPFQLAKGPIERALEARLITEQSFEAEGIRHVTAFEFELHSLGLDRSIFLLQKS